MKSPLGRMGEGFERAVVGAGYRGEELFDALVEVGVRAGGALGARLRLWELRLLWRLPSMLAEEPW